MYLAIILTASIIRKPAVLFAVDMAGVGSIIAAITALLALFVGYLTNKRTATNAEGVSYVDNNLKTMQATLDWVTRDNENLRATNDRQRDQITEILNELEKVEVELSQCRSAYARMQRRLDRQGPKE